MGPTDLGDRILLGQGVLADWAYDGEVIYHEVTHAVMSTLTSLAWHRFDEFGVDHSPGGLHEGLSDYFAASLTGNAQTNLYAGQTSNGPEPLADFDKLVPCGAGLTGEEHQESLAFSSALWAVRKSLRSAAKRAMFDSSLFVVVSSLDQDDSMADAISLLLKELPLATEEFVQAKGLGAAEAAKLRKTVKKTAGVFSARGLPGCNDRVVEVDKTEVREELYVKGPNSLGFAGVANAKIPASVQFSIEVDSGSQLKFHVGDQEEYSTEIKAASMKEGVNLTLLVKPGNDPIRWNWEKARTGEHDAAIEVPLILGESGEMTALVTGLEPGPYHLQLTNAGSDWSLYSLSVAFAE